MEEVWKICVCGIIKKENKFLIIKRISDDTSESGFWEFPSGKVEFGESINEGLLRELLEEVGIDFSKIEKRLIGTSEYIIEKKNQKRYTVQLNYLIEVKKELKIKISGEHTEFAWVNKEDKRIDAFLKEIIKNA